MLKYIEKYRLLSSFAIGIILCLLVSFMWLGNQNRIRESQAKKVSETAQLITQQLKETVKDNMNTLQNLKSRLEITDGAYFDYWEYDAGLIVEQAASFLFVEWIDSSMIIQKIEPRKGNEEAIGLDISNLDYRKNGWLEAKTDSIINFTYWLELVQGRKAFLADAPVYYEDKFQGTITAGMNFTAQFDIMLQGLDQYHVKIIDERGNSFYQFGNESHAHFLKNVVFEDAITIEDANTGDWKITVYPNEVFSQENSMMGSFLNLALGVLLSILVAVLFYFMQTAFKAQKLTREANEKIRALIESSPMAIYAIDKNGVVKDFWNKAAEEMLGWTREEAMGNFMPHVAEGWEQDFKNLMKYTLSEGNIVNKEIVRYRKDGSPIKLRLNVGRIVGENEQDQQMLATLEDITKEVEYKQKLENSLHEKEVLLSEVHHRVKNNLAIIVGLIELQKSSIDNDELNMMLKETQNRIYSISGVHELLYNTESFTEISFEEYAIKLIERIRNMFKSQNREIFIEHKFDSKNLNINQAIPLGLLLNELITNSFKHAFEGQKEGKISIRLKEEDQVINVLYKDNGRGFKNNIFESSNTLGVTLIKTLITQLEADYTINTENGFSFHFKFALKEKGAHSNL